MQDEAANPYRAPLSAVEDFEIPVERPPRPRHVSIAIVLLWLVLIMQFMGIAVSFGSLMQMGPYRFIVVGVVVATWLLTAVLTAMIERGRNWARVTYTVLLAACLPLFVVQVYSAWRLATFPALWGSAQALLQVVAITLLFIRPAGRWFRNLEH